MSSCAYRIAFESLVSGNLRPASGSPKSRLGYLDGQAKPNPLGCGSAHHNCKGQPSHPGDATNPYKQLDLALTYRPAYFDSTSASRLSVCNVTNERKLLNSLSTYGRSRQTVLNNRNVRHYSETPRHAHPTATYAL